MSLTPGDALQDLRELMHRGLTLDFAPPGNFVPPAHLADLPVRRSAVLILFGPLDHEPTSVGSRVAKELDVLLTRRATGMRHHPGQIAFPGGGADLGDINSAATALREAHEETGLDPAGVEVLGQLPAINLPVSNNLVTPVVGWWHSPSEVAADHAESIDVFRAPVAELLDPAARGTSVLTRTTPTGLTAAHRDVAFKLAPRLGGHIVWGFTGVLLANLFDELGWAGPWDPDQEFTVQP